MQHQKDIPFLIVFYFNHNLPSTTNFTLGLTGNNLYFLTVNTVYGICNGILWAQAQALGQIGQMYMAIPLCSITTINGVSIADLNF